MNTAYCLFLLILSIIWNQTFVKAVADRLVKSNTFYKGQYYDVFEYEWDITATRKVGIFDYTVSSDHGVSSLLMNSTDFINWENKYYPQWLERRDFNFQFLNDDLKSFMCMNPLSMCTYSNVNFPYRKLYLVILKGPPFDETNYTLKDNIDKNYIGRSAQILYDPLNPQIIVDTTTTTAISSTINTSIVQSSTDHSPPTSSAVSSSSLIGDNQTKNSNNPNKQGIENNNNGNDILDNNDDNKNKDEDDGNKSLMWLSIIFGTLFILLLAAVLFTSKKNKTRGINEKSQNDETENQYRNEAGANINGISTKIPYNPLHAVKRVAYEYKSDDVTIERNNILEITKRFNDGWANAINPKDGKECLVPLVILEGDLNEDLSNVPLEEKSTKNILATPKSLYENEYISQKDYEEMKRNDEWMKKVKLMKYGKPESGQDIVDSEQFKYVSHPIQETTIEENPNQQPLGNRKSMIATVVNSNSDLLNADHVLEVCEEEDEEDEFDL